MVTKSLPYNTIIVLYRVLSLKCSLLKLYNHRRSVPLINMKQINIKELIIYLDIH